MRRTSAWRRGDEVPTTAPRGSSASVRALRLTNASRASSRSRNAVSTRPSGSKVGMSLEECTARSMRRVEQRLLDLLGEQALAAGLGQRPVLDAVAGGADHLELDPLRREAVRPGQRVADHAGLRQRQRAAARADPQDCGIRGRLTGLGLRHRTSQW